MLIHELSHYFVARNYYYKCNKIQLSAFGAVLYGDFDNAYGKDQIVIALAGPVSNIATCVLCCALWWVFPATYNYTYSLMSANISMAVVNLLPAYPLDGGRVLVGIFQLTGRTDGIKVARQLTSVVALGMFGLFVVALFAGIGLYSTALFAVFLYASSLSESDGKCYIRLNLDSNIVSRLGVGVEKKTLVFDSNVCWNKALMRMRGHYIYDIDVVDSAMQLVANIPYNRLCALFATCNGDTRLIDIVNSTTLDNC